MRLSDARLQAESSMCMYSEHGFDPLIRPETGLVCQSLSVVSNWIPGSPQAQDASEISRSRVCAEVVSTTSPPTRAFRSQLPALGSVAFCMNSSVVRTELLAFWNWMLCHASPFRLMS